MRFVHRKHNDLFLQSSFSLRQTCLCERCSFLPTKGWKVRSQNQDKSHTSAYGSSQHFSPAPTLKPSFTGAGLHLPTLSLTPIITQPFSSPGLLALPISLGKQFLTCSPFPSLLSWSGLVYPPCSAWTLLCACPLPYVYKKAFSTS